MLNHKSSLRNVTILEPLTSEDGISPKKLIEMKRERFEANKNSQMLMNRISLLEKQEHKMLNTIQRVQQRAA